MKRITCILVVIVFSTIMLMAEGVNINGIRYLLDEAKLTASVISNEKKQGRGSYNDYSGDVIIPGSIKYKGKNYRVTEIKANAFDFCPYLYSVIISNGVTTIGNYAFCDCIRLAYIELPNDIKTIGNNAFYGCRKLNTLSIPNSVTEIGECAFSDGPQTLNIAADNPNYCFEDGVLFNKDRTILIKCFQCKKNEYEVPNGVKEIADWAFGHNPQLTSITIPNSVTKINSMAFGVTLSDIAANSKLTRVILDADSIAKNNYTFQKSLKNIFGSQVKEYIIGDHVTAIGDYAFSNCQYMTSVTIGAAVTSIGSRAFYGCSGLTSVIIPENVKTINKGATFVECTSLTKVQWNAERCIIENNEEGKFYPPFADLENLTEFIIGETVKEILEGLCFKIKNLTSISLPNSVTSIKKCAFKECPNLVSIDIPNSVTSIECSAFKGCTSLTSITIPYSIKSLAKCTFEGCTQLKEIKYPIDLDMSKLNIPSTTKLIPYNDYSKIVKPQPNPPTPNRKIAILTWLNFQPNSQQKKYSFKVGVKSESKIEEVCVYINGNLNTDRGIVAIANDGYDMTINRDVTLINGSNIIKVVVKNADGESFSERTVTYSERKNDLTIQQRKIALVMGNADYMDADKKLKNPVNDATDLAAKLERLGFTVIRSLDQTQQGMEKAINDFGVQIKNYDAALFYYAGHGMRSGGYNYLVPVDANLPAESYVKYNCINANMIFDIMEEAQCPMKIIILDACRNNPFARRWNRGVENEGLGVMAAPKGTFVAFSTAPGEVAKDGTGRNSPYTSAILQTLDVPNLALMDFFQEVLEKVYRSTDGTQSPWTSGSFLGKFYFNQK